MTTRTRRGKNVANQNNLDNENKVSELVLGSGGVKRQPGERSPTAQDSKAPAPKKTRTAFGDRTNQESNANAKLSQNKKSGIALKVKQKAAVVGKGRKTRAAQRKTAKGKQENASESQDSALPSSQESDNMYWDSSESSQESNPSSSQGSSSSDSQQSDSMTSISSDSSDDVGAKVIELTLPSPATPVVQRNYIDIDKPDVLDPSLCAEFAHCIFEYYKTREAKFRIPDYMPSQPEITPCMRAILIDWLVEVQENFELNHETLYIAVKIIDRYLSRVLVPKTKLQLVGATALFIASKFDERMPPVLDDFLYICDDVYGRPELLRMEMAVLHGIDYDLGFPLSYRYLRRYAKCARANMQILTLARYILELSLMELSFCRMSDSLLAASTLRLALRMKGNNEWDSTTIHYTGFHVEDLKDVVQDLNKMLIESKSKPQVTIRTKYSHQVFHYVARVPPLDPE